MIGFVKLPFSASVLAPTWIRPSDWIDISSVANNEINLLVTQGLATSYAVTTSSGTYSIDWGDGTVETGRVSGTTYQHSHTTGGTVCSQGYSTWKVRIYGASGNITSFAIKRHTLTTAKHFIPILWAVFGTNNLTTFSEAFYQTTGNIASCPLLVSVTLPSLTYCTSFWNAFQDAWSMVDLQIPASGWGAVDNLVNAFANCRSLATLNLPSSWGNITSLMYTFQSCMSLRNLTMPSSFGIVQSCYGTFQDCQSLQNVVFPTSWGVVTETNNMFYGCFALTSVSLPATMSSSITSHAGMFCQTANLSSVTYWNKLGHATNQIDFSDLITQTEAYSQAISIASRIFRIGINGVSGALLKVTSIRLTASGSTYGGSSPQVNVSYTSLAAAALNTLFGDLPTVTGKTINITGCPGAATCTRSIATGKGWTVTG